MSAVVFNKIFSRAAVSARRLTTASRGARSLLFSNKMVQQQNSRTVPRFNCGGIDTMRAVKSFSTEAGGEEAAPGEGNLTLAFGQSLINMLPHSIYEAQCVNGELTLVIDPSSVLYVLRFLRDTNCQYKCYVFVHRRLLGRDAGSRSCTTYSVSYNTRIRSRLLWQSFNQWTLQRNYSVLPDGTNARCLTCLVFFSIITHLRRILTDYGFDGHPMRKDF